jgi:hypothetical protein
MHADMYPLNSFWDNEIASRIRWQTYTQQKHYKYLSKEQHLKKPVKTRIKINMTAASA